MLMPYGSKRNHAILAKVGDPKASALMPYGSARHGELVAKAGETKVSGTAGASAAKGRVVRLNARR